RQDSYGVPAANRNEGISRGRTVIHVTLHLFLVFVVEPKSFALDWIVPFETGQFFVQLHGVLHLSGHVLVSLLVLLGDFGLIHLERKAVGLQGSIVVRRMLVDFH